MKNSEAIDAVERVALSLGYKNIFREDLPGVVVIAKLSKKYPEIDDVCTEFFSMKISADEFFYKMMVILKKEDQLRENQIL